MEGELMYQDLEHEDRIQALSDRAVSSQHFSYMHKYSEEQLAEVKDSIAESTNLFFDLENEKKEWNDKWKSRVKPVTDSIAENAHIVRYGGKQVTEPVYYIPDHVQEVMKYVNGKGVVVHERPLSDDERQMRLDVIQMNDGTNG